MDSLISAAALARHGDRAHAAHARYLTARYLLLLGRVERAGAAARQARIPSVLAEVQAATLALETPAARLITRGKVRLVLLADIERLLTSKALVVAAGIEATRTGFALVARRACNVVVLAPPADEAHSIVLALLADGEAWSSSALALVLGASQRTVQRALEGLATAG